MSEIKREITDLLSKYSEFERESNEILSKFDELISAINAPSKNNASQRCDELKDKFDKNFLKSDDILEKLGDLTEALKSNDPHRLTIEGLIKEKCDMLCDRDEEICIADEKLQKLIEKEETRKKKLQKQTRKTNAKKETPKTNAKIKTAMYLGYITMATLVYLMSNKC